MSHFRPRLDCRPGGVNRNLGIDALRVILMFLIVMHHSIVHGLGMFELSKGTNSNLPYIFYGINAICIVSVNCFFWISGFFGVHFDIKKMVRLYVECVLYAFFTTALLMIIGALPVDGSSLIRDAFRVVFPVIDYWFVAVYLVLIVFSPMINRGIEASTPREDLTVLCGMVIVNTVFGFVFNYVGVGTGYTVLQGFYMYIVGKLCKKHHQVISERIKTWYLLAVCIISLAVVSGCSIFFSCIGQYKLSWRMFAYNNPLIVFSAVSVCLLFCRIRRDNRVLRCISHFSANCLAVYLITDYSPMRSVVFWPVQRLYAGGDMLVTIIFMLVYAAALTFLSIMIDKARVKVICL